MKFYLCDGKKACHNSAICGRDCKHTRDANHAINSGPYVFVDIYGNGTMLIEKDTEAREHLISAGDFNGIEDKGRLPGTETGSEPPRGY